MKTLKNGHLIPNLLKLIKFGVSVQNDEPHTILDYFLSAVIPFNKKKKQGKLGKEVSTYSNMTVVFGYKHLSPRFLFFFA